MKKVALLIPPYLGGRYFLQPPLGLLWTSTLLKNEGIDVKLYDLRVKPLSNNDYEALEYQYSYIVFCTSELDIIQNYPVDYRFQYALSLCKKIKSITNAKIILVGAHGSVFPEKIKSASGADYIVVGEWELAVRDIIVNSYDCTSIQRGKKGLFDTHLLPDYSLVDFDFYYGYSILSNDNVLTYDWSIVQSSRGCPFCCSFCYNFFGNNIQYRSACDTYDDLKVQAKAGVKTIFFIDSVFGINRSITVELCQLLINNPLNVKLIVQTRASVLDKELLFLMKRAGFSGVWIGIESFDDSVLSACGKGNTSKSNIEALRQIREAGLVPAAFMIQGLPTQSIESSEADLQYLKDEGIRYNLSTLMLRPGSPLYDSNVGLLDDKAEQPWRTPLKYKGKTYTGESANEALKLHRKYARKRPITRDWQQKEKIAIWLSPEINHEEDCFKIINIVSGISNKGIEPQINLLAPNFFENPYFEEIVKYFSDTNLSVIITTIISNVREHEAVLSTIKGEVLFQAIDSSSVGEENDRSFLDEMNLLHKNTLFESDYSCLFEWLNYNFSKYREVFYI